MPTSVNFEKPIGHYTDSRVFQPGDKIRISGKVTGLIGLGEPGILVRVEVIGNFNSLYYQDYTSIFGNYGVDVTLPNAVSQAKVIITAGYIGIESDRVEVPIGIGTSAPDIPVPESLFSEYLKYAMIGGMILLAIYGISKIAPAVRKARATSANPRRRSLRRAP